MARERQWWRELVQLGIDGPDLGVIIPNMGLTKTNIGLSEALFTGVQQRVLALLFGQPDRSFHVNELMRLASSGKGGLQRELRRLTEPGLVSVTEVGKSGFTDIR